MALIPRDFWTYPSLRMPSLIDELDDLLPFSQSDTTNALSISEDENHIHIDAAVPGVDPDDIEVTFDRGMLWIRGEVRREDQDQKRKFFRRAINAFSYRVAVPGEIDPNAEPEAEAKNGMIMIKLPKVASSTPQKITVKKSPGKERSFK